MPIVSSIVVEDAPQIDGRRWIRERHTDQVGEQHERIYMALAGVVVADGFSAAVAILNQHLIDREMQRNIAAIYADGPLAVVTTVHAALADIRIAIRGAYATAKREQAFALGAFLDTLTNTQLGNIFGVSGAALTALRTRLQTKTTQWNAYIAGAGE